jgi:hypothetical protein
MDPLDKHPKPSVEEEITLSHIEPHYAPSMLVNVVKCISMRSV